MQVGEQLLFFFSALGAFNGILLSFYFFFYHRPKKLSNYFLGVLLFALSLRIGKSVLLFFNPDLSKVILQIGLTACFFIGPALLFYLKSEKDNIQKISPQWKNIFIALASVIILAGVIFPYPKFPEIWNQYYVRCIYWEWLFFMIASFLVLRKTLKKAITDSAQINADEKRWIGIYFCNAVIFLAFFFVPHTSYILGSLIFSFSLYIFAMIFIYKRKEKQSSIPISIEKYQNKKIETNDANVLLGKLESEMKKNEIFKNSKLKLKDVATLIELSPHQLSQLLNDNLGKSFSQYINEYRIQAACKLLVSNQLLTAEGIGQEVGFSSKSTFFSTFKKMKGLTPAKFKSQLPKHL